MIYVVNKNFLISQFLHILIKFFIFFYLFIKKYIYFFIYNNMRKNKQITQIRGKVLLFD